MIINKGDIYATVWKAKPSENGKYIDLQISTSEKNKDDDGYANSGWFPRAIGHAANSLKDIKERDRIKITSSKFTNEYDKEKGKSFFKFIIFEAEILGDEKDKPKKETAEQKKSTPKKEEAVAQSATSEADPW